MAYDRVLRVPPKGGAAAATAGDLQLKSDLVAALGGMAGVRRHVRHPDGSVTDEATGAVVSGPDPDWVADQEWRRSGRRK